MDRTRGRYTGRVTETDGAAVDRWWERGPAEVDRVSRMLTSAGVLGDPRDRKGFREKPWKWSRERATADILEQAMRSAGVDPVDGWEMTLLEVTRGNWDRAGGIAPICKRSHDEDEDGHGGR